MRAGMGLLLPGHRGSSRPDRLLTHAAEVVIDNGFPVPVAPLSQFGHQSFDVTYSIGPTLVQIGLVRIEFAAFAWPDDFGKARSVNVAPDGIAIESHERSNRDLTHPLLMQLDHFFIATLAPGSPALALSFGCRERR